MNNGREKRMKHMEKKELKKHQIKSKIRKIGQNSSDNFSDNPKDRSISLTYHDTDIEN